MRIEPDIKEFVSRNKNQLNRKAEIMTLELFEYVDDIFLCDIVCS